MPRGISIHIGLNSVDPNAYGGWDGQLSGCINDARDMKAIADGIGYQSSLMTDSQATADAVLQAIGQAAQQMDSGDTLLLTYSGHGGQVPDANGDEADGQDETWVLWDRMLVDDEIFALWSRFKPGTRVFMLSDSCHSGTVAKSMVHYQRQKRLYGATRDAVRKVRLLPEEKCRELYRRDAPMYKSLQWVGGGDRDACQPSVILISGCQDNQLSSDGDHNGLFTEKLLDVWANGAFSGTYAAFHGAIADLMPAEQTPNFYKVGPANTAFEAEKPFTIGGTSSVPGAPAKPSITAPAEFVNASTPPTFTVNAGANRYFALEVTTNPYLFDSQHYSAQRNDDNFFQTWSTRPYLGGTYPKSYTMPQAPWDRLRAAGNALYYRLWASDSDTGWVQPACSTADSQAASAPSIRLTEATATSTPGQQAAPSIQAPESVPYASTPAFTVDAGAGRYFAVEVTTNPYYFMDQYAPQRTDDNFFKSWTTRPYPGGNYPMTYAMTSAAWQRLRASAARLYYRMWTTKSANDWVETTCTTPSAQALQAKSFAIAREAPAIEPPAPARALDTGTSAAYVQRKLEELVAGVTPPR